MELEEMKQLWQQHDAALKESRRVNEELVRTMLEHQSAGKLGKMKVMEYANLALCSFLILAGLVCIPRLHFTPDIIICFPLVLLMLLGTIVWSLYKLNFMNRMDFAGNPVLQSVDQMKRFQLMTQQELTVAMIAMPVAIIVLLAPVHQIVHGTSILDHMQAYIYALIPAIAIAMILIYWFYRKLIMPHLRQITRQLEDIRRFKAEE